MDFLNIVLNQTGREAEVHGGVAKAYLGGALEAGNLQPAHDVEAAWLFQYEGLVDALGYEDTRRTLSSFDLSSRFRHFATSAAGTMDWLVAKRAIAPPIVRGEGGAIPPARPVLLPEAFPWADWLAVAQALRAQDRTVLAGLDEAKLSILVELLYLQDDLDGLRDLLNTAPPATSANYAAAVRRDLLVRLDRRCWSVTVSPPGQAILLGGGAVSYRFD